MHDTTVAFHLYTDTRMNYKLMNISLVYNCVHLHYRPLHSNCLKNVTLITEIHSDIKRLH